MNGRRLIVMAVLSCIAAYAASAQALSTIGGLAGAPFRLGSGPRGMAMGNAMVAVVDGPITGADNPALLPYQSAMHGSASYSVLSLDRHLNLVSYGQPLRNGAGISLQLMNAGVGNVELRDRNGLKYDETSTSENAVLLSFGLRPGPDFSMGVTAKLLYYSLYEQVKSTTLGVDVGFAYHFSDVWTAGAALLDLSSVYKWDSSKLYNRSNPQVQDRFPMRKALGISANLRDWSAIAALQLEWVGGTPVWKTGAEVGVATGVWLRAGVDQISLSGALNARPAFGLALQQPLNSWTISFEYTYVVEPFSPSGMHVIGLGMSIP